MFVTVGARGRDATRLNGSTKALAGTAKEETRAFDSRRERGDSQRRRSPSDFPKKVIEQ